MRKEHFTEHRSAATVAGDPLPSISPPLTGIEMVMANSAKRNWIMPEDYDHAKAEATHLIYESDVDSVSVCVCVCVCV